VSLETRKPGYHIAWKTVTYRSVVLLILAGAALFLIAVRLTFPQFSENSIKAAGGLIDIDVHPFAGSREFSAPGGSTRSLRCLTSTGEYKSEAI